MTINHVHESGLIQPKLVVIQALAVNSIQR